MAKGSNSAASIALELQRLSNEATEKSFQYNTQEANTARAWQKMMSDTAHQREVQDLKAAGLNPVLATNNGAQSYTTSSASAQAENAANAVGNVWSSDISARATRAAAAQSAAATRYAAAAQASAARYAASLSYEAKIAGYKNSLEVAQKNYDAAVYKADKAYQTAIDAPVKSIGGAIDKFANKAGLYDVLGTAGVKGIVNKVKLLGENPGQFFKEVGQGVKINANNFKLSVNGSKIVNQALVSMGIRKPTAAQRAIFVKAFLWNNYGAASELYNIVNQVRDSRR